MPNDAWPELPYAAWKETCATLQLWTQIVGKIRLSKTPWLNHSWHVALYPSARGLTTSLVHDGDRAFQLEFDFIDHALVARTSAGLERRVELKPRTVADFYAATRRALAELGVPVTIHETPSELADAIPFPEDQTHASYDGEYARRFWRVLLSSHRVFERFRSGFLGKCSPTHFFWGSFDLAVTRFSGRRAPSHPGGFPNMPDDVTREAYSHEVSSAGFWPGGGPIEYAAYYSYGYPSLDGLAERPVQPEAAVWSPEAGQWFLPYDAVRAAPDPQAALTAFLRTTYEAVAEVGAWDRAALECELGEPRRPRRVE